jgi:hypothetical protein
MENPGVISDKAANIEWRCKDIVVALFQSADVVGFNVCQFSNSLDAQLFGLASMMKLFAYAGHDHDK